MMIIIGTRVGWDSCSSSLPYGTCGGDSNDCAGSVVCYEAQNSVLFSGMTEVVSE